MLLKRQTPVLFVLLTQYGAEHDIITASAATDLTAIERLLHGEPQLVHETDDEGNTSLHWACVQKGYSKQPCDTIGLVSLLLAAGGDVNARNRLGHTPLHRHLLDGNCEACQTLLEHGATPNVLYGVMAEDFEVLDYLLDNAPDRIHWRAPRDGQCLLHLAVQWECHTPMFEYLIARGAKAELEAHFGRAAWTPLLLAIQTDDSEAAEVLIRHGADVNARENRDNSQLWNSSAIRLAVTHDRIGLAEMLIARGADIHERGLQGETLLCRAESSEVAELLIRAAIDPATQDDHGESPLNYAIDEGRRDVAMTLVRHGAGPTFFYFVAVGDCEQVRGMLDNNPELIAAYKQPVSNSPTPPPDEDSIEYRGDQ